MVGIIQFTPLKKMLKEAEREQEKICINARSVQPQA